MNKTPPEAEPYCSLLKEAVQNFEAIMGAHIRLVKPDHWYHRAKVLLQDAQPPFVGSVPHQDRQGYTDGTSVLPEASFFPALPGSAQEPIADSEETIASG